MAESLDKTQQIVESQPRGAGGRRGVRSLEEVERAHILHVLDVFEWDKREAAIALGISLNTLYNRLNAWGLTWKKRTPQKGRGSGRSGPLVLKHDGGRLAKRANRIIRERVRRGVIRPATDFLCADCGEPATCYDHRDYNKPLAVDPVCNSCNGIRGPALPYRRISEAKDEQIREFF